MIELDAGAVPAGASPAGLVSAIGVDTLEIDPDFTPVPMSNTPGATGTVVLRGTVDEQRLAELNAAAPVVAVWKDTPIAPFGPEEESPSQG